MQLSSSQWSSMTEVATWSLPNNCFAVRLLRQTLSDESCKNPSGLDGGRVGVDAACRDERLQEKG